MNISSHHSRAYTHSTIATPQGSGSASDVVGCRCRFCSASLRHVVIDLGMSPLANNYLTAAQSQEAETFLPLRVYVCEECWLVQLQDWESPENIFRDYAYFSSFSDSWVAHARAYVEAASERFGIGEKSRVVELASNDGYLLRHFRDRGVQVLGIEPASNVAATARLLGIDTIDRFFGEATARELIADGIRADLLIGNNVLAHVPNLNDFVRGMKLLLSEGGVITMEFPHLMQLLHENQFDTIYHEHFSYFSLLTVEKIFLTHGLRVFDVEELSTHGGSLRIYACHIEDPSRTTGERVGELRSREYGYGLADLTRLRAFGKTALEVKRGLLELLITLKRSGKSVIGYGAPAKGNTLLNFCGIRTDFVDYTVDRNPNKQGRLLPGTHIPVAHPDRIRETRPDYVLILPWNLKAEVIEQLSFIREWGGRFIVPIPCAQIVD